MMDAVFWTVIGFVGGAGTVLWWKARSSRSGGSTDAPATETSGRGPTHGRVAILELEELQRIHEAAVAAGLSGRRSILLDSLPPALAASLPTASVPSGQMLMDLVQLNGTGRLVDGSLPLASWLTMAEQLTGAGEQAEIFRALRSRVREWEEKHAA